MWRSAQAPSPKLTYVRLCLRGATWQIISTPHTSHCCCGCRGSNQGVPLESGGLIECCGHDCSVEDQKGANIKPEDAPLGFQKGKCLYLLAVPEGGSAMVHPLGWLQHDPPLQGCLQSLERSLLWCLLFLAPEPQNRTPEPHTGTGAVPSSPRALFF